MVRIYDSEISIGCRAAYGAAAGFSVLIFGCPERPKSRKSTANVLSKGRPFKGKYEVIVCQKKFY
ncbi:hypothetical protein HMPREF0262_02197 [Clostridium sp. ATCC 29733]|nr:hypothetical protein HMPREF0262_02197 [Clostridium sp. ATCC 29733]